MVSAGNNTAGVRIQEAALRAEITIITLRVPENPAKWLSFVSAHAEHEIKAWRFVIILLLFLTAVKFDAFTEEPGFRFHAD